MNRNKNVKEKKLSPKKNIEQTNTINKSTKNKKPVTISRSALEKDKNIADDDTETMNDVESEDVDDNIENDDVAENENENDDEVENDDDLNDNVEVDDEEKEPKGNDDKDDIDYNDDKCLYKYADDESDEDELESEEIIEPENKQIEVDIISKDNRITKPFLTKYERVRLISDRTKQLLLGAKPMIKNVEHLAEKEIAELELKNNVMPLFIERPLPNGKKEIWHLNELQQ